MNSVIFVMHVIVIYMCTTHSDLPTILKKNQNYIGLPSLITEKDSKTNVYIAINHESDIQFGQDTCTWRKLSIYMS